jgi:hypothetical protein
VIWKSGYRFSEKIMLIKSLDRRLIALARNGLLRERDPLSP